MLFPKYFVYVRRMLLFLGGTWQRFLGEVQVSKRPSIKWFRKEKNKTKNKEVEAEKTELRKCAKILVIGEYQVKNVWVFTVLFFQFFCNFNFFQNEKLRNNNVKLLEDCKIAYSKF